MADKLIIGLTGNIATGKSLVLRMLQELGASVIDADKLVHVLMRRGGSVYNAIVEEFGKFILDRNDEISRARLGKIVFSDPKALDRLEQLTHPGVIAEVKAQIANAPTQVVAVEAIKLFESGLADLAHANWVVVAAPEVQYRRLIERRRMSPDQAKQRIMAQSSQQEKARKADLVIDNSGALAKTWATVKKNYVRLLQSHTGRAAPAGLEAEIEPARTAPARDELQIDFSQVEITLRRAKRGDLTTMAKLISLGTKGGVSLDTDEMMELLFSRAYLLASVEDHTLGMIGWQTENLVAGLQDFFVLQDDMWDTVGKKLLDWVHDEIDNLSCEVSLVFVPSQAGSGPIKFLESYGYEQSDSKKLVQDWREAAIEWQPVNSVLLYKKIREHRIMVPM